MNEMPWKQIWAIRENYDVVLANVLKHRPPGKGLMILESTDGELFLCPQHECFVHKTNALQMAIAKCAEMRRDLESRLLAQEGNQRP